MKYTMKYTMRSIDLAEGGDESSVVPSSEEPNAAAEQVEDLSALRSGLLKDLEDKEMTDVVLACQGREFACHKLVLALGSEVFKAMLFGSGRNGFIEAVKGRVDIVDFEADEVEQLVRFVYGGNCDFGKVSACRMLSLAEKYCFERLKERCCQVS